MCAFPLTFRILHPVFFGDIKKRFSGKEYPTFFWQINSLGANGEKFSLKQTISFRFEVLLKCFEEQECEIEHAKFANCH